MTEDLKKEILDEVEKRIEKARNESFVNKSGHLDVVKVVLICVFTATNLAALVLHGNHLSSILNKLDALETVVGIASKAL